MDHFPHFPGHVSPIFQVRPKSIFRPFSSLCTRITGFQSYRCPQGPEQQKHESRQKQLKSRFGCWGYSRCVRGLLGTDPPDLTLESASPSPPPGSIWYRFNIDSTLTRPRSPHLTPEEGRARRIRGWGPAGLCLITPPNS